MGHFNSVGVRGQPDIIKKVPVSSSFGALIWDSVVAPHDKVDVSGQLSKTRQCSLKDLHGNVTNLHNAHVSLSIILATMGKLNESLNIRFLVQTKYDKSVSDTGQIETSDLIEEVVNDDSIQEKSGDIHLFE